MPTTFTASPRTARSAHAWGPRRTCCLAVAAFALAGLMKSESTKTVSAAEEPQAPLAAAFVEQVQPFLRRHCVRCHNADKLTSGIRVDHLNSELEDRHLKLWEAVRRQVADQAMPPEDEPQPTAAERQQLEHWIARALDTARSRPVPKNGGARRLTVAQYRNTLRALLLYEDDPTDQLPPDAVSRDGFVNNQETLSLSPLLLEAYFDIAEQALRDSVVDPLSKPTIQNFRVDLGTNLNREPCPDQLVLGADSLLLNNADFVVTQSTPSKPFPYEPFVMRTQFRFIEGYQGNDTVRGWRDFNSIYHAVFACMRGAHGYPKGRAYETVPRGLLLRPAIPSAEVFGVESTYGPRANFKISLRELPDHGRFRVTVTAAKFDDGLLLDPGTPPQPQRPGQLVAKRPPASSTPPSSSKLASSPTLTVASAGIYQVDVYLTDPTLEPVASDSPEKKPYSTPEKDEPGELSLVLGERPFARVLKQPAFLVVRLPAGELPVSVRYAGMTTWDRVVLTPLAADEEMAKKFLAFERRAPQLGVHLGLRRDCGSTLSRVGGIHPVTELDFRPYVFEGAIRNFPSPDVEPDNVNYLAGIREIGVRSEFTDGRDMPRLLIRSVEFEGPFYDAWPPASHRNLFPDSLGNGETVDQARRLVGAFAARAFRRPLTAAEEASLVAVYERSREAGSSFRAAVQDALQVVLASPQFLFLIENSSTPEGEPLNDHELASKLSYFLWNGPPDDELLRLAAAGSLRKELETQTDRLIADARVAQFLEEFAPQWLALDKFAVLEPDRARFPKLTRDARGELQEEPRWFLQHLLRENLSLRNLLDSEFILANEVVASYYDLGERTESGFQFLPIRHERPDLGGLFGQAAIMAGLSNGRESNPVKRGAWMARRIIAAPPDDPPPNVPMLKEDPSLSLRERLERHRNQPGCAQCHAKIDPWGVPFEEIDAGGRFKSESVDARSSLPPLPAPVTTLASEGSAGEFNVTGVAGLKRHLLEVRLDQVAFSVLKHLTTYAVGRGLSYNELEFLKKDGLRLKADGYRMRDMVRYVVQSPMFLEK